MEADAREHTGELADALRDDMIISHKHRFIFIKTRKTAGTSMEIALSTVCGPGDVITPILPVDEDLRKSVGGLGPQNFEIKGLATSVRTSLLGDLRLEYAIHNWNQRLHNGKLPEFYNHMPARAVRKIVVPELWDGYFTFCFERNSFSKVVSHFHFQNRQRETSFSDFVESGAAAATSDFELYASGDRPDVDFVGRYENLETDWATVCQKIGLPKSPSLPRAKTSQSRKQAYRDYYGDAERHSVEVAFAREIALFGYEF